jgi:multidrug efflux pump subunit AcrA (membrane-fusion protein)
MFSHRVGLIVLLALLLAFLSAGATVMSGQEEKDPDPAGPAAPLTLQVLEKRLWILEQRLDALLGPGDAGVRGAIDRAMIRRVRPRFECLVSKVRVKPGQMVRKGEPLADLFSTKLVMAKNDLLAKSSQWRMDKTLLEARRKLVDTGAISPQLWIECQLQEEKSRLEAGAARDYLLFLGLSSSDVDGVEKEEGEQKAMFTLRALEDGRVIETHVESGEFADPGTTLMTIVMAPQ